VATENAAAVSVSIITPEPLLTLRDIERRLRVSRVSIWTWRRAGRFPEPDAFLGRDCHGQPLLPRWRESTVAAWLAQPVAERPVPPPAPPRERPKRRPKTKAPRARPRRTKAA